MNHMYHPMINLNKQLMVRKMSDDEKTENEKLIELQNYFNKINQSKTKRTLQEPTTDYDYLNQELIDQMDTYVLQFESNNPNQRQITSDYAKDLKKQLASKTIAEVKDITDFEQMFVEDPHKEIIFTDGSKISLPTSMIERANIKEQQRKNYMERVDKNNDGKISRLELQQSQSQSKRSMADFEDFPESSRSFESEPPPLQRTASIFDNARPASLSEYGDLFKGEQLYIDGESDLDFIPSQGLMRNLTLGPKATPEEERVAEYGIAMGGGMGGAFGFGPDPTIETFSETINKDDPSKLKKLGEKVKKGFQDLSTEQKAMGLLMGLDVGLEAVNYLGPARKEARDRIEILEDRRERGQLGVDERQDAETMKYMISPVRAMAEESEREQQAVMAGMGETRSAADLRRLRESRDAQMTDALSRAGQEVARQQMARKEAEKRELNQLQAYQQENLRNLTNRISGSVAQMAGTFGANVAAEADLQKELSPDTIDKYTKIIMDSDPSLTPEEARRMATDYGMGRAKKKVDYAQYFSGVRNPPF